MLSFSAYVHSPMTDEIAHFASGLGHLLYGDFELYNVNPPLARTVGTLLFILEWHEMMISQANCILTLVAVAINTVRSYRTARRARLVTD